MSDAFELGRQAFLSGDDISLCPYDESDGQHDEWEDGWFSEYMISEMVMINVPQS